MFLIGCNTPEYVQNDPYAMPKYDGSEAALRRMLDKMHQEAAPADSAPLSLWEDYNRNYQIQLERWKLNMETRELMESNKVLRDFLRARTKLIESQIDKKNNKKVPPPAIPSP